ncbi:MAG TPA: hypothetical protein VGY76_03410 [Solirubrobacteraceae bacterium]|jgi:hypothetical protein|nr:hypothetical protein [Solirubrobacteraceae bacterium]
MSDFGPGGLGGAQLAANGRLGPEQPVRDDREVIAFDLELAWAVGDVGKLLGSAGGSAA